jgi:hypothetical protein
MSRAQDDLLAVSRWVDAGNVGRDPEALLWHRVAKVGEEGGEVIQALIGAMGGNPRKGLTHSLADVEKELLDVAMTALGAVEHIRSHDGQSLRLLELHITAIAQRAGVATSTHSRSEEEQ